MKNIVITGASKGVGLEISKNLVQEDYNILGISRQISPELKKLIETNTKGKFNFIQYDLFNIRDISKLISNITNTYGPIYGLVNNAGIGLTGVLATMHETEISLMLKVNIESSILLSKYTCRSMLHQEDGRIINISSIIAKTGFNGMSVYAATKASLEGFSKSLSRELGKKNITVNCIAPGYMKTDMTKNINHKHFETIERRAPLGLPEVNDIANMVNYLLSSKGKKITGAVFTIDGGSTA